jgi:hypothetical protein
MYLVNNIDRIRQLFNEPKKLFVSYKYWTRGGDMKWQLSIIFEKYEIVKNRFN